MVPNDADLSRERGANERGAEDAGDDVQERRLGGVEDVHDDDGDHGEVEGARLDELEGEQAAVHWFLVPTDQTSDLLYSDYDSIAVGDGYIGATSWLDVSEILDTLILTNSWPTLNFTPDPSCSARSYIYNEIATSLNQESDREAVEEFLEKHDINFRRGSNNQSLIGTYNWETSNRNISSEPAEVTIYVGAGRRGRFERFRVE